MGKYGFEKKWWLCEKYGFVEKKNMMGICNVMKEYHRSMDLKKKRLLWDEVWICKEKNDGYL